MIAAINVDNLQNRLASEETEASLAIYDMCATGAIYQSQSNYDYYTVNSFTGNVMLLNRWNSKFEKQNCSFKFMYSTKYRKVQDG